MKNMSGIILEKNGVEIYATNSLHKQTFRLWVKVAGHEKGKILQPTNLKEIEMSDDNANTVRATNDFIDDGDDFRRVCADYAGSSV